MTESTTPQLLRISDLTSLLRMSRSAIYREIKAGNIKAFNIGKSLRVTSDEISRYVSALENSKVG